MTVTVTVKPWSWSKHLESWPVVQEQGFWCVPGLYWYIPVCTGMYSYTRNFTVHTSMYSVHTWIYKLTNMYFIWWRGHYNHAWVPPYTRPTLQVSPTVVQSQTNVCSHIFRKALFIPVHTSMYQCCTSTYSHRSHSHFISNQAPSRLRPSRVSFLRLSDDLKAEFCLSEVSSIVWSLLKQFQKQRMYQYILSTYQCISIQAPSRLLPSRVSFLRLSDDLLAEFCLSEVSSIVRSLLKQFQKQGMYQYILSTYQ